MSTDRGVLALACLFGTGFLMLVGAAVHSSGADTCPQFATRALVPNPVTGPVRMLPEARAAAVLRRDSDPRRPLSLRRDRLCLPAVDRACVVVRTPINLLHLRLSFADRKNSTGRFADVQKAFAGDANA